MTFSEKAIDKLNKNGLTIRPRENEERRAEMTLSRERMREALLSSLCTRTKQ